MNGSLLSVILYLLSTSVLSQQETGQILSILCVADVSHRSSKTYILFHFVEMDKTATTWSVDLVHP